MKIPNKPEVNKCLPLDDKQEGVGFTMEIKTTREILKTPLRQLPKGYNYNYNTKWIKVSDIIQELQQFKTNKVWDNNSQVEKLCEKLENNLIN